MPIFIGDCKDSKYNAIVKSIEQLVLFASSLQVPIIPVTVSSVSHPFIISVMNKYTSHSFLSYRDSIKVNLLEGVEDIINQLKMASAVTASPLNSISNGLSHIPFALRYISIPLYEFHFEYDVLLLLCYTLYILVIVLLVASRTSNVLLEMSIS
jgi:hypothetical protein